ncbi:MAG: DUF1178 family protein [Gammaproteobacteria bacterium]|nr:DUF1178 family protein [Gammaproteobacteria bacterium]
MIIYDLACNQDHKFEGWFQNRADFDNQAKTGMIACPVCNSSLVRRVPSAHHVNKPAVKPTASAMTPEPMVEQGRSRELLKQLHSYIEDTFDNVGSQFAEEARRIHHGEAEERGIRGTATGEEVKALKEEGIPALPIPAKPVEEDQLN